MASGDAVSVTDHILLHSDDGDGLGRPDARPTTAGALQPLEEAELNVTGTLKLNPADVGPGSAMELSQVDSRKQLEHVLAGRLARGVTKPLEDKYSNLVAARTSNAPKAARLDAEPVKAEPSLFLESKFPNFSKSRHRKAAANQRRGMNQSRSLRRLSPIRAGGRESKVDDEDRTAPFSEQHGAFGDVSPSHTAGHHPRYNLSRSLDQLPQLRRTPSGEGFTRPGGQGTSVLLGEEAMRAARELDTLLSTVRSTHRVNIYNPAPPMLPEISIPSLSETPNATPSEGSQEGNVQANGTCRLRHPNRGRTHSLVRLTAPPPDLGLGRYLAGFRPLHACESMSVAAVLYIVQYCLRQIAVSISHDTLCIRCAVSWSMPRRSRERQ